MIYVKKDWDRVSMRGIVKLKTSPILTCPDCPYGWRFIEIDMEKKIGYKRTKCPRCVPYLHWSREDSNNLHTWYEDLYLFN